MEIIKQLRKSRGLTQQQLADKIGVVRSTIAMYETSASEPDNATLNKLADFFNISVDYLLGRETYTADTNIEIPKNITQVGIAFKNVQHLTQAEIDDAEAYILFRRKQREEEQDK